MKARGASALRGILVAAGGLLAACSSLDVDAPPAGGASGPAPLLPPVASSIAVPLTGPLGLAELERIANDQVPRGQRPEAGEPRWQEIAVAPRTRVRLAFWRDDVVMAVDGGQVRTTVRVYFRLALQAGGAANAVECGSRAAPGVATLPLVTTFAWHPDWRLVPTTVAGEPEVTSSCPALVGVDPAAFLAGTLRQALAGLAKQIDAHLAARTNFRTAAERYWAQLAEPIPLGEEAVLRLNPRMASASPVVFTREVVATEVALVAYPEVVLGRPGEPRASPSLLPLPALGTGAASDRFVVNLRVHVPLAAATTALRSRATLPRVEQVLDRQVRITDFRVYGSSQDIVLAVELDEPVHGTVYLTGRPAYRAGRLALDDFDFHTDSRQALLRTASRLLHATFRTRLGDELSQTLGDRVAARLGALRRELEARLNRPVGERLSLRTAIARLEPMDEQQPAVVGDELVLPLRLEGTTRLVAHP
ncbi:MAG TPA: DUF4403 family protein [Methylomirabilota bacterium]|jgi:hypothetical protein|nr:DUF4403 family protein [Methylomirabilota bacterium]